MYGTHDIALAATTGESTAAPSEAEPPTSQSTPATPPPPHVVVVGAGWAGWAAAKALTANDCRVTLLDALPDPTGETPYLTPGGKPFEAGQRGFWKVCATAPASTHANAFALCLCLCLCSCQGCPEEPQFFFFLCLGQLLTAGRRQLPTIVQYCFLEFVYCSCLDHEAESVPGHVRFCWRYEPSSPPPPLKGRPRSPKTVQSAE